MIRIEIRPSLLFISLSMSLAMPSMGQPSNGDVAVTHGTINIVLGDKNGLVVLTDSMQTVGDRPDPVHPTQKLFQLDDRTICAIAGYLSLDIPGAESIPAASRQIAANYIQMNLANPYMKETPLRLKLDKLIFLFDLHVNGKAEILRSLKPPFPLDKLRSTITIAGYDSDDVLKVEQVSLIPARTQGEIRYRIENFKEEVVKGDLVYFSAGIPARANEIYANPDVPGNQAIEKYAQLKSQGMAGDLSLADLERLAESLKAETQKLFPGVGGDSQVALFHGLTFTKGAITLKQAKFEELPPDRSMSVVKDGGNICAIRFVTSGYTLFVRDTFESVGNRHCSQPLDGNFFSQNFLEDLQVTYRGVEPFFFDDSNVLVRTDLIFQGKVNLQSPEIQRLLELPWTRVFDSDGNQIK